MSGVNIDHLEKLLDARDQFCYDKHPIALLESLNSGLIESVRPLIQRVKELEQQRSVLAAKVSEMGHDSEVMASCAVCEFRGYCPENVISCEDTIVKWCEEVAHGRIS